MADAQTAILLIDDDEAVRLSLNDYLGDQDYRVFLADNGRKGIELFANERIDLAIIDLRMPEMDGIEVLERITEVNPETPLIVFSGTGSIAHVVEALRKGAWDYIRKPLKNLSILDHAIENALEKARLKQENRRYQHHLEQMVAKGVEKIRDREERLGAVIQSAMDGFFLCDSRGRIREPNDAFCSIVGFSEAELSAMHITDVEAVGEGAQPEHLLHNFPDQKERHRFVDQYRHKNGSLIEVEVSAQKIDREDGLVVNFVRDITGLREMENRLQQSQKMEAIGTLAGGIAHDFNNILSSILGFTELAKMRGSSDEKLQNNLNHVIASGLRAKDLVNQILTFSRRAETQKVVMQIAPLVKESLKLLKATISPNIEITYNLDGGEYRVVADPSQIHQVIMNLLTNAAHAMKKKGGRLDVRLGTIRLEDAPQSPFENLSPGEYVRLSISDTGHGISAAIIDKVFEPFFTTKVRGEGTGLGLSTAYGIIQEMKGTITVDSVEGQGAAFDIYLPEHIGTDLPVEILAEDSLVPGTGTILIVDDETNILKWSSLALSKLGYTVVSATNGHEALDRFQKDPSGFDLILTDLNMPVMSGLEFAKRIKAVRSNIPVILCTGFSDDLDADALAANGISEIVMKPIIVSRLSQVIAAHLT